MGVQVSIHSHSCPTSQEQLQQVPTIMQKSCAVFLVSMLLASCQAGNVGRQRRVHTSATSTGASQLNGLGLSPLWHATFASNDEYIETPLKRIEVVAPRSQQETQPAQGVLQLDQLNVTPEQLQQLLLGAVTAPADHSSAGQMRFFGGDNNQGGEGRFLFPKTYLFMLSSGNGSSDSSKDISIVSNLNNIQNIFDNSSSSTSTTTTTTTTPAPALRMPGLMPLQYYQTRQGQDMIANAGGLHLPYNMLDYNQAGLGGAVPLVPVTLGNNAVGYVPLNLRMFRKLIDASVPIRESEDEVDVVTPNPMEAIAESELESQPEGSEDVVPATQKAAGSRFQFFGQHLRRPVIASAPSASDYAVKSPFPSFKSLRRVQYV